MSLSSIVLVASLIVFMLLGLPVTFSLGISSILAILLDPAIPLVLLAQRIFTGCDKFAWLAVLTFILAGDIMGKGGLSKRLVAFAESLVGWISGGLSLVSLVACMFFAAISGSSVATTAAIGGIMYPEMVKRGYPKGYTAAIQAIGGTLGIIIPPSVVFVVYGNVMNVSIAKLLASGIIPGVLCGIALCIYAQIRAKKDNYPRSGPFHLRQVFISFKNAFWALLMPVIILGGIYSGIFTPTESGAVAVLYGLIICLFVYREIGVKDVWSIVCNAAKSTSNIMFLVVIAQLFAWLVTYYNLPAYVANAFLAIASNKISFLIIVNILLILAGMFMDTSATVLILAPILAPIAVTTYGVDPIHFGLVFVFILAMGQASPPFGTTMFVACSLDNLPAGSVIKPLFPFILVEIFCGLLFSFVPFLSTWLPSIMV